MKFSELAEKLGMGDRTSLGFHPDLNPEITGVTPIEAAQPQTLSYVEGGKFVTYVSTTLASALIVPLDEALQTQAIEQGIAWMATSDPRLLFARAIAVFYQPFRLPVGIHPTAIIDPSAQVGENAAIAAHVVIQAGVTLGQDVCIHPNVVVYPGARIGDRTLLHANCVIHERTQIGTDCVIHSGAVIGSEGFGFVPTAEGWYKMEQSGIVVLEAGVEVGCNSTIDRPAVGETRIGRQTKIDNLVQIGHGCQIGHACALASQVGLAGGVKVGNRVILGGQVGAANQAIIGDGVMAGAKAGIHSNVEAGTIVSGSPCLPQKAFLKAHAVYSRLPELYQTVKQLKKRLEKGEA